MENERTIQVKYSLSNCIQNFSTGNIVDEITYKNSEKFFPWNLRHTVLNSALFPFWSGNLLYYFQQTSSTQILVCVNTNTGEKESVFDCAILLGSLSKQVQQKVDFSDLPLDKFSITQDLERLCFSYQKSQWYFDLKQHICVQNKRVKANQLASPDNKFFLELNNHNLFLVGHHRREQLTTDGQPYYDYASSPETNTHTVTQRLEGATMPPVAIWSPDSSRLVTHKLDQRQVQPLHLLQNSPKDSQRPVVHSYRMSFSGDAHLPLAELIIVDTTTKSIVSLKTEAFLSPYLTPLEFKWVWWSKDSQKVYFLREMRGAKEINLYVADSKTGTVKTLITEHAKKTYIEPSQLFLWPHQAIVLDDSREIIWLSERDGHAHLYLYDIASNAAKSAITQGEWCVREVHFYDDNAKWLYFTACGYYKNIDPSYKFLFRCRLDGSELQCLTEETAHHTIHISPQKNCFVDTYSTINTAPVSVLKNMDGKIIAHLETADLKGLHDLNWVPPKRFCVKARDDMTDIYGNLYFPSYFDANKKYPLIDHIYPGPQVYRTVAHFSLYGSIFRSPWIAQALAELGFIVMHIDGLGTPSRSKAFHDATYQNMGDCGIPDHATAIKQLASQYDFIDTERIGITGYSGGGYAAARAMLLLPDFFKVAVAAAGNHDLRCYPANYGEKYNGLNQKTYKYQSNAALAEKLEGKLLLVHGEMDDNVHPCATSQFVDALIRHNKYFDMLIMPNQNHRSTFDHPYYVRRYWDYFVEHLLKKVPPKNVYVASSIPENFPQVMEW